MIHRLALLMGGTGAAGVLALALAMGGFGAPLPNTADAFVPVANNALAGGQLPVPAPTDQPTAATSLGGGGPQETPRKVVDTVYVAPAPAVHSGRPATDANQSADHPRDDNNGDNNGGNQAGDDQNGDSQGDDSTADDQNEGSDDQAGEDDHSNDGDHSDDGGGDAGGQEPGDD